MWLSNLGSDRALGERQQIVDLTLRVRKLPHAEREVYGVRKLPHAEREVYGVRKLPHAEREVYGGYSNSRRSPY